jgi:hypothetical protein
MAHFAKIGLNSKVTEILSVNNNVLLDADGNESEKNGIDFLALLITVFLLYGCTVTSKEKGSW